MRSRNYHVQLIELIKSINESIILTIDQTERSYEFLFEGKKVLPFEWQRDLHRVLTFLKDCMAIYGLHTLNDLLKHFEMEDRNFSEFIDDLTYPSPSTVWIDQNGHEILNAMIIDLDPGKMCILKAHIHYGVIAYCPATPFIDFARKRIIQDNKSLGHEQPLVDKNGEDANMVCAE